MNRLAGRCAPSALPVAVDTGKNRAAGARLIDAQPELSALAL